MATAATANHLIVINCKFRRPGLGRVTNVTRIGRCDMCQVLATGGRPIVTAVTGTDHFTVIGCKGRAPLQRRVTRLALRRRLDMGSVLPGNHCTVMTAIACTENLVVIHG